MRKALVVLGALLAACETSAAPDANTPAPAALSPSPELQALGARGREIYLRDQSAWGATDAMVAAVADPAGAGIRGWVTEPVDGAHYRTIFVAERDGVLYPVYEAVTDGRRVTQEAVAPAGAPLSEALTRQRRAIDAAIASNPEGFCGPTLNTVAIPIGDPAAPEAFDVYLLSASNQPVVVIGGHLRLRVDADDLNVIEEQRYSSSCMEQPINPNTVAYYMTNNVSETASEIHVFLSLTNEAMLVVMTALNGQTWAVAGERIEPLDKDMTGLDAIAEDFDRRLEAQD